MTLLAWRMAQSIQLSLVLMWWLTISAYSIFIWLHACHYLRRGWDDQNLIRIVRQICLVHAIDGCLWGSFSLLCFGVHDGELAVIATATLTGIAAQGLGQNAAIPQVFLIFFACEIIVGDLPLLVHHDMTTRILAFGGLLLVPTFTLQALNSAKTIRDAIQLSIEKEALARETEKARHAAVVANKAKSVFLAAASHDLRQPIHAQALFLEALSATRLDHSQSDLLSNARLAASASSELLDALLDFSRIEAGVVEPSVRAFSLQDIFYSIDNEAAPLAEAKGLIFRCRETTLATNSDPSLLELILRNLVANAIKYTEAGGVLLVARRKTLGVVLEVWDTGIGIHPKDQQAVFQEFHQLNNPARDRRKGLGLGLAIAKGLADRLGHTLTLRSDPGRGSVFRLVLPLHIGSVGKQAHALVHTDSLQGRSALVLDDDPLALQGMGSLLKTWGMHCMLATTVADALALAKKEKPDIFITDFRLGDASNGADAIVLIRRALAQAIPAIMVTGDTAPERLRDASASGIPLLHKPVRPNQLRHQIEAGLG